MEERHFVAQKQDGGQRALPSPKSTEPVSVGLLFSSKGLLALNKPAGMISQGSMTSSMPELWELVQAHHPSGNLVHRIDRFTTGINLAATSLEMRKYMSLNWHRITRKIYLAVIENPGWDERVVDAPIDGKCAATSFKVLERNTQYALVECQLVRNGRTHQIRRHLRLIGSPIVGDRKYGGSRCRVRSGQLLHAWRVEVRLPDDSGNPGAWVRIQAPLPADFRSFSFNWSFWDSAADETQLTWLVPVYWQRRMRAYHAGEVSRRSESHASLNPSRKERTDHVQLQGCGTAL